MALRAGHRIGMTAGDDVKHFFLEADIGHRLCERRIDVAEQEVDLIAFDQLVGFLHRDRGFAAGRIFDEQIDFTAENAALGVDLIDGELRAEEFVFSDGGECAARAVITNGEAICAMLPSAAAFTSVRRFSFGENESKLIVVLPLHFCW
jgi:hypothetical protein